MIQLFNDYINYISSPEDHIRISGPATIGNLNIASENIQMNDYNFDSLASDTLPYTGFEVQGSTRVHGGCSMFALYNQFHSVSISFYDISNQFDNAKIYINITGKSGVLLTYSTDIGDCVTFDPRSIIPYGTYYGEFNDMFSGRLDSPTRLRRSASIIKRKLYYRGTVEEFGHISSSSSSQPCTPLRSVQDILADNELWDLHNLNMTPMRYQYRLTHLRNHRAILLQSPLQNHKPSPVSRNLLKSTFEIFMFFNDI